MVNSMTGFARLNGHDDEVDWVWEIRSVNNKGFDLRQRLPEGCDNLEKQVKSAVTKYCARGTIYLSLKSKSGATLPTPQLNINALETALRSAKRAVDYSHAIGVPLGEASVAEFLSLPYVMEKTPPLDNAEPAWVKAAAKQLEELMEAFITSRMDEGKSLQMILSEQLNTTRDLVDQASTSADERKDHVAKRLQENVEALMTASDGMDKGRLEQELAIIAVKSDVTEELDRLRAHVDAADALLRSSVPIGRKFDFLMQEFNREANTLCSKSGSSDLTRIGLDLKTVIDQMREQVQNVE